MTYPPVAPGPSTRAPDQRPDLFPGAPWVAAVLLGVVLGCAVFFSYRAWAPAGWPGKSADPGVTACEDLRDGKATTNGGKTFTEDQYREIRGKFAGSSDANLRAQGIALMDLVWQVSQLDDPQTQAWPAMPQLMQRTAGVQAACAGHGVILPST
jgi:hypothetical protein